MLTVLALTVPHALAATCGDLAGFVCPAGWESRSADDGHTVLDENNPEGDCCYVRCGQHTAHDGQCPTGQAFFEDDWCAFHGDDGVTEAASVTCEDDMCCRVTCGSAATADCPAGSVFSESDCGGDVNTQRACDNANDEDDENDPGCCKAAPAQYAIGDSAPDAGSATDTSYTVQIQFYSDSACTTPSTTFDDLQGASATCMDGIEVSGERYAVYGYCNTSAVVAEYVQFESSENLCASTRGEPQGGGTSPP